MNNYRQQRQMKFILNSLAQLTTTTNKLAESHAREVERLIRLEDSFVALTAMLNRHEEQHDQVDHRMIDIETCLVLHLHLISTLRKRLGEGSFWKVVRNHIVTRLA